MSQQSPGLGTDPDQGLIGDEPALSRSGRLRTPDRRELSLRWLSGAFLTGVASTALMGASLFVALDGKQLLAVPPEVAPLSTSEDTADLQAEEAKTARLFRAALPAFEPTDRRRMSVSTVTRVGDADVVRTKPFEVLSVALGADHKTSRDYPAFNPLNIFSDGAEGSGEAVGSVIYGANVETEASIRVVAFAPGAQIADDNFALSDEEVEEIVRATSAVLPDGGVEVASLNYVDPARFGIAEGDLTGLGLAAGSAAVIVPQNISVSPQDVGSTDALSFTEDLLDISNTTDIRAAFEQTGYSGAANMARAVATLLRTDSFKSSHTIRLGLQMLPGDTHIVRSSIYSGSDHVTTIALNDREQFVPAPEPVDRGIMEGRDEKEELAMLADRDLPTAYDAIYRSILAYDLPREIAAQIVRMVAADVDFRAPISSDDKLKLFFSVPEEGDTEAEHELLYVESRFRGELRRFYRFATSEGSDFFDADGRSARQFLLRNPVPNGVFRSPFGMRRHPILGYSKMHWGVDWAAPRGTPIIAPGNGTVTKAGWSNGYGKQTVIKHPNGYETSYSHQSRFAKGVREGARVRQGQVIGYIGTTGLSTGPHLHYEMRVNSERVDPMRVRLPKGTTLRGERLEAFQKERARIDELLADPGSDSTEVAGL